MRGAGDGAVRRRELALRAVARQVDRDRPRRRRWSGCRPRSARRSSVVPVGRPAGLSPPKAPPSMIEPRTEPSGLPGPTPCSFTGCVDDQVLVVGAARVLARVGARVVRVDHHQRARGWRWAFSGDEVGRVVQGVLDRRDRAAAGSVSPRGVRFCRGRPRRAAGCSRVPSTWKVRPLTVRLPLAAVIVQLVRPDRRSRPGRSTVDLGVAPR